MNYPHINTILDKDKLDHYVKTRLISKREHPTLPLSIYCYTSKAVYENLWDDTTLNARGLILDQEGYIIGRGMPKFFNYGTGQAPVLSPDTPVVPTDKLDGSLIIVANYHGKLVVATKGAFGNEQADWAQRWLLTNHPEYLPQIGRTDLTEAIYPENKIVVDYQNTETLYHIVTLDNATTKPAEHNWPGPLVPTLPARTLAETLALPPREGKEGVVIYDPGTNTRIKVKYEEYIRIHAVVTGVSTKAIWKVLAQNQEMSTYLEGVPDEVYRWIETQIATFEQKHQQEKEKITALYTQITEELKSSGTPDISAKEFALRVQKLHVASYVRSCLFQMFKGQPIDSMIWRTLEPEGTGETFYQSYTPVTLNTRPNKTEQRIQR